MLGQIVLFLAYAVLNTGAMAAVKQARVPRNSANRLHTLVHLTLGGVLYLAAIWTLVALLRQYDASSVYPTAIGATVVATNAVGAGFYGESITGRKLVGTLFVLVGITLMLWDAGTP